jgi:hypothetical protein
MSIIKVYANWRVIMFAKARNPAKKRKGEETGRTYVCHLYVSLGAIKYASVG